MLIIFIIVENTNNKCTYSFFRILNIFKNLSQRFLLIIFTDCFQAQGTKFEKVLQSCFPGSPAAPPLLSGEPECDNTTPEAATESVLTEASENKRGMLETILEFGLRYRSASQQTWQVVQHPSR